jgi:hypothetical protein
LDEIAADKNQAIQVKKYVEAGKASEETTYDDIDLRQDLSVIYTRGAVKVIRLYAPAVILGGVGVACLTKSHQILKERNLALTAAYIAVDTAFKTYRERVVDRYGEETDRELRYDSEEVDIVDDETGKLVSTTKIVEGDHGMYARWFDEENTHWSSSTGEKARFCSISTSTVPSGS